MASPLKLVLGQGAERQEFPAVERFVLDAYFVGCAVRVHFGSEEDWARTRLFRGAYPAWIDVVVRVFFALNDAVTAAHAFECRGGDLYLDEDGHARLVLTFGVSSTADAALRSYETRFKLEGV